MLTYLWVMYILILVCLFVFNTKPSNPKSECDVYNYSAWLRKIRKHPRRSGPAKTFTYYFRITVIFFCLVWWLSDIFLLETYNLCLTLMIDFR